MRIRSTYESTCLCGERFASESREHLCPYCNRLIILDWAYLLRSVSHCTPNVEPKVIAPTLSAAA